MAKIEDYVNIQKGRSYQLNASVPASRAQDIADSLEFLKLQNLMRSKSALICDAIIGYAENQGFQSNGDEVPDQ